MAVDLQQELANLVQAGAAQQGAPSPQGAPQVYTPPPQGPAALTSDQLQQFTAPLVSTGAGDAPQGAQLQQYTQPLLTTPTSSVITPPPQGNAEQKKEANSVTYEGDKGSGFTVYALGGKNQPPEMFDKAMQHYATTGKDMKGFTVLREGSVPDVLRGAFESVNQPIQRELPRALGRGVQSATQPVADLLRSLNLISPESHAAIQQHAEGAGSTLGKFLTSTFDTPEKAGVMGATLATGGLGASMSLPLQMLRTGVAAGIGDYAASKLTGGNEGIDDAIATGAIAAAAQGFTPLVRYTMGMLPISKEAQQVVARKMMDEVKSVYGGGANAAVLEQMGSNPAGVTRLANIGLDALTGDLKASTQQLKSDVISNLTFLPRSLSKGVQNTLRAQVRDAEEAITTYLGDVTKAGAERYMKDTLNNVSKDLTSRIINDFIPAGGKVTTLNKAVAQRVADTVDAQMRTYAGYADQIRPGATLLQALKDSSAEGGFNPLTFQQTLQGYQQLPGSFMETIGNIARRGAPIGKTDYTVGGQLKLGNFMSLPGGLENIGVRIPAGTVYAGQVEPLSRRAVDAGITATSTNAIKDFLGRGSSDR